MSESHFNIIFSSAQVEPVQDGRQPGVEVCRFADPGRGIKFRRFETGIRLLIVLRRGGGESGMMEDMEAWVARISEAVFQAASKAEQSYMRKSRFDSIDIWNSLMVLFKSSTLFRWITVLSLWVNIEMR